MIRVIKKDPVNWTAADISSFWDWQSRSIIRQKQYFTALMAPGIVRYLKKNGLLKGNVLDYGCGAGHLLEQMMKEKNVDLYGLDYSADSLFSTKEKTGEAVKELVLIHDLPSPFSDAMFDTVTCVETIEHLQDDQLEDTMKEFYRITKPGGKIFITTPYNEDLEQNLCFCPFCKSEFHQMQHMQSFNVASLTKLAKRYKFEVQYCNNINIEVWRLGKFKFGVKRSLQSAAASFGIAEKPVETKDNLIAVWVKPL